MKHLLEAVRPDLGEYTEYPSGGFERHEMVKRRWSSGVKRP